jgi:hypothetical protein
MKLHRNAKDITNQRFGELVALRPTENRLGREMYWEYKCDCGNIIEKPHKHIKRTVEVNQNCGCKPLTKTYQPELPRQTEPGETGLQALYSQYKYRAKKRNYTWELTKEEVRELTQSNCVYCNAEPTRVSYGGRKDEHSAYVYNGIDRVDNTEGYYLANCVPCCFTCNWMKRDLSDDEFIKQIEAIYSNYLCK